MRPGRGGAASAARRRRPPTRRRARSMPPGRGSGPRTRPHRRARWHIACSAGDRSRKTAVSPTDADPLAPDARRGPAGRHASYALGPAPRGAIMGRGAGGGRDGPRVMPNRRPMRVSGGVAPRVGSARVPDRAPGRTGRAVARVMDAAPPPAGRTPTVAGPHARATGANASCETQARTAPHETPGSPSLDRVSKPPPSRGRDLAGAPLGRAARAASRVCPAARDRAGASRVRASRPGERPSPETTATAPKHAPDRAASRADPAAHTTPHHPPGRRTP